MVWLPPDLPQARLSHPEPESYPSPLPPSGVDAVGPEQIIILRYARQPTDRSIAIAHHHSRCVLISTSLGMYTSSTKPGKAISFRAYFLVFGYTEADPRQGVNFAHFIRAIVQCAFRPPHLTVSPTRNQFCTESQKALM